MTDQAINGLVADCVRYWQGAGIAPDTVAEMQAELETHLRQAEGEGKSSKTVVGPDLGSFAESWAREKVRYGTSVPSWDEVRKAEMRGRRKGAVTALGVIAAAAALTLLVFILEDGEDSTMDDTTWMWIWLGAAMIFAFGEILTAGFFMLPFAAGAAAAFVLAIVGAAVWLQWVVFLAVSIAALFALRSFVRREDEQQAPVGANRYTGKPAVVLEDIDPVNAVGRVRMETEEWRATSTDGRYIAAGTVVEVVDVTGTRLVVQAPVE